MTPAVEAQSPKHWTTREGPPLRMPLRNRSKERNHVGNANTESQGNATPLQYSCLEDPMDRGAW